MARAISHSVIDYLSVHLEAAIDVDRLAGDVVGVGGAEEGDDAGHIFGVAARLSGTCWMNAAMASPSCAPKSWARSWSICVHIGVGTMPGQTALTLMR